MMIGEFCTKCATKHTMRAQFKFDFLKKAARFAGSGQTLEWKVCDEHVGAGLAAAAMEIAFKAMCIGMDAPGQPFGRSVELVFEKIGVAAATWIDDAGDHDSTAKDRRAVVLRGYRLLGLHLGLLDG